MLRLPYFIFILFIFSLFPHNLSPQSQYTASVHYEQGRKYMSAEDWYSAVESFLECIRLNSAHAEGNAALAECYYELAEFDEALVWIRKARTYARSNMSIANLEVFILIALGHLDAAQALVSDILAREPYNREALFAAGELDIARGRTSEALLRYREAVRRYPDDRRLLISLALVSGSMGDNETSLSYINRALAQHPGDYRVFYYAAYINAQSGKIANAIHHAEQALFYKPNHEPTRSLMANLRYMNSQYDEAARLADIAIAANRQNMDAWYLKGLSYIRLGRYGDAITVLSNAIGINPENEFIRTILEDAIITSTSLEDARRIRWSAWHFNRARDYRSRNLIDQALFEYRRGLRLYPFAQDRRDYAELLRLNGYPARYLEELIFLQDQGKADRSINDAVEAYGALLSNALFRQWQVNPVDLAERHWKIAVFSLSNQSGFFHADSGAVVSSLIKEFLIHDRNIVISNLELKQNSFSQAFRQAREAGADYFLLISVTENERDISVKGELFTGRTGAPAGNFYAYRTGTGRLRDASRGIVEQLSLSMPLRGRLLVRKQGQGLINKGKADGVQADDVYDIVKKGKLGIANEGIAVVYEKEDLVGKITINSIDEEIAIGTLERNGFFDRIEQGDEIILMIKKDGKIGEPSVNTAANPELRALLRQLTVSN